MTEPLSDLYARTRGRLARSLERSVAGSFTLRVLQDLHRMGWLRLANAMAFDFFLALVPMLAFAGWVLTTVVETMGGTLRLASDALDLAPEEVQELVHRSFRHSSELVAPAALMGALWLASSAFHTLLDVVERALHAEPRGWLSKRLIALGCVLAVAGALTAASAVTVTLSGGPARLLSLLGRPADSTSLLTPHLVGLVVAGVGGTAALALFYRIAVRRPGVERRVWPGALTAVVTGSLISSGFAYYARTLARYTLFYGSLAAVAVVLLWVWLCCIALIIGAVVNAELESTERLSTLPAVDTFIP